RAWRGRDARLLHDVGQLEDRALRLRPGNAVVDDLRQRDLLEGDDGLRPRPLELVGHAPHNVRLSIQSDDRVAEGNDERLSSDQRAGAQNRMAQTELTALPGVEVLEVLPREGQRSTQF